MATNEPVTVTITRTVKAGCQAAFEKVLQTFIPHSLGFPGHLGVQVIKPTGAASREYIVVIKFSDRGQWEAFRVSPEYVRWTQQLRPLLETDPRIRELCGLESWFTLPGSKTLPLLPRYKMALLTWLGVYPTSLLLTSVFAPFVGTWPSSLQALVFSGAMVTMLTWPVMPLLTRVFRFWLYPHGTETHIAQLNKEDRR